VEKYEATLHHRYETRILSGNAKTRSRTQRRRTDCKNWQIPQSHSLLNATDSHVMHIVPMWLVNWSKNDDAFFAGMPIETVSNAPQVRAVKLSMS